MKLEKCPFCGGEAIVVKTERCGRYIGCWDCGGRTEEFETDYAGSAHDKAIAAWNSRTDHIRDATKMVSNADRIRSMSDEEAMNCPKCNSANIYTPAENLFICNRCGHEWQAEGKQ